MLTHRYAWGRSAQVAATGFAFPAAGDHIEVCLDGYRGHRFTASRVYEHEGRCYVVFRDPCNDPGCTEHDYSTVPVTAVRPFVSG
jgi:hypothetical protein